MIAKNKTHQKDVKQQTFLILKLYPEIKDNYCKPLFCLSIMSPPFLPSEGVRSSEGVRYLLFFKFFTFSVILLQIKSIRTHALILVVSIQFLTLNRH